MSSRYIVRETHQGRIVPRPDFGLFPTRRAAKRFAASIGLDSSLIIAIRRRA